MEFLPSGVLTFFLMMVSILVTLISWSNRGLLQYGFHREFYSRGDYSGFSKQVVLFQFLHGDLLHLVLNMYFLFQAGFLLEKSIGTAQYAILFASTTLLSVYALYLFAPRSNTIGISGFCMAILSYLWITLSENGSPEATNIGFLLLLNIFMGFLPGISFVGHMAGAVSGLCFWYMSHILF